MMNIRFQLSMIKNGALSVTDYFHKVKSLVDILVAIHQPLHDYEIIAYLLVDLNSEYDSFVMSVTMHTEPMSLVVTFSSMKYA